MIETILQNYSALLSAVDRWFARCLATSPGSLKCSQGCSQCCRGLFDITLMDAWYLKTGFEQLDENIKQAVLEKARKRLERLRRVWPEFDEPYLLNVRPEEEWEDLMPDSDETPCPLLTDSGECLVYEYRPMTCRLHGIPLVDVSGEVFQDEWCTLNFGGERPLENRDLYWNFSVLFQTETALFQQFTMDLFNQCINELDTLIPVSLLMDYGTFDWKEWRKRVSA
jgi:Fe-S-cluster containining protein